MGGIGAIILAAGSSSRLGQPKQLLRVGEQTLLERAVAAAIGAGCAPIIVVTGACKNLSLSTARGKPENPRTPKGRFTPVAKSVTLITNENWHHGIGTSIRTGMTELNKDFSAAVVILACDQPHVDAEIVRQLIAKFHETTKPIVASRYADTLGIPALFARACFPEFENLPPDTGAKHLISADPARVTAIDFPAGAIDLDTPADLAALPKE